MMPLKVTSDGKGRYEAFRLARKLATSWAPPVEEEGACGLRVRAGIAGWRGNARQGCAAGTLLEFGSSLSGAIGENALSCKL